MDMFRSGGRYGSPETYDEEREKKPLVGRVEDIKPGTETGKKRVIVREQKGGRLAHSVEMPIKEMRDVERKKDYKFMVAEKERERQYGYVREKKAGSQYYVSDEKPEPWGMDSKRDEKNNRFGGVGKRTQFPTS